MYILTGIIQKCEWTIHKLQAIHLLPQSTSEFKKHGKPTHAQF